MYEYTIEEKIMYMLNVLASCKTVEHINGVSNMYTFVSKQHPHQTQQLNVLRNALVEAYKDFYDEHMQGKTDDEIHSQE